MRDEFSKFHPAVNFTYFLSVIICTAFFNHPLAIVLSLFSAILYSYLLKGGVFFKSMPHYIILLLFTAIINPLFNHRGATILFYFQNGNPFTLESVIYGIAAAGMLLCALCWFACLNRVFTSDKMIFLFGKIMPSGSLFLSMSLRFVPRFQEKLRDVTAAQQGIGMDMREKGIRKIKNGARILSVMVTAAMENSIETSDAMKSRGYGLPNRTAYAGYRMERRDYLLLVIMALCLAIIFSGVYRGAFKFIYFPVVVLGNPDFFSYLFYFIFLLLPPAIDIWGEVRWRCTQSKI